VNDNNSQLKKKNWALLAVLAGFCITMFIVSFIRFGAAIHQQ
jgi:hypothetical protein